MPFLGSGICRARGVGSLSLQHSGPGKLTLQCCTLQLYIAGCCSCTTGLEPSWLVLVRGVHTTAHTLGCSSLQEGPLIHAFLSKRARQLAALQTSQDLQSCAEQPASLSVPCNSLCRAATQAAGAYIPQSGWLKLTLCMSWCCCHHLFTDWQQVPSSLAWASQPAEQQT